MRKQPKEKRSKLRQIKRKRNFPHCLYDVNSNIIYQENQTELKEFCDQQQKFLYNLVLKMYNNDLLWVLLWYFETKKNELPQDIFLSAFAFFFKISFPNISKKIQVLDARVNI